MKNDEILVGAIGVGNRLTSVLKAVCEESPNIQVTALADPDPGSLESAQNALQLSSQSIRRMEDILRDPEIQWVFIGSPNRFHPDQVIAAFDAGKHVFCEKPLGISPEVIPDVVRAWKASGKTFAFGLVLRYSPLYRLCHRLIGEGRIGRIVSLEFNETLRPGHGGYIHGNWRRDRSIAGSHFLEKCCHDIDLCLWFISSLPSRVASFGGTDFFVPANAELGRRFRDPESGASIYETWSDSHRVSPFSGGQDIVDNQVVILEFKNGVRATFHTNCNSAIPERRFYICGSEGTLRADAMTGILELRSLDPSCKGEIIETGESGGHAGGDKHMASQLARTLVLGDPPAAGMLEAVLALIAAGAVDRALDTGTVIALSNEWSHPAVADLLDPRQGPRMPDHQQKMG